MPAGGRYISGSHVSGRGSHICVCVWGGDFDPNLIHARRHTDGSHTPMLFGHLQTGNKPGR